MSSFHSYSKEDFKDGFRIFTNVDTENGEHKIICTMSFQRKCCRMPTIQRKYYHWVFFNGRSFLVLIIQGMKQFRRDSNRQKYHHDSQSNK